MALPQTVRVKLSSEVAEGISLSPVVVQELPIHDLLEYMLAVTGKDEPRIREVLQRGTMVSGASRFRWVGWEAEPDGLRELLAAFPDPDPARLFHREACIRVTLRGGRVNIDVTRETADRKGFFKRRTFWGAMMDVLAAGKITYAGYSYRDRADRYLRELSPEETKQIAEAATMSQFSKLREQIRITAFTQADLFAVR